MPSMTRFQWLGLGIVLGLLALTALGGTVRVTDSGLACPDWPGCYGGVVPSGDFGNYAAYQVWLEWTHRLAAALMGFVIIGYAFYTLRRWRHRPGVWVPAAAAIGMLALQVVLGGLTVTERLEAAIVTAHLAVAMLIVLLMTSSWLGTFGWQRADGEAEALGDDVSERARSFAWLALGTAVLVYALVVVGSYVTHTEASYYCGNQWPFCSGDLWPSGWRAQLHMSHRFLALIAGGALVAVAIGVVGQRPRVRGMTLFAHAAATLFAMQVIFGALTMWTDLAAWTRALHLTAGALTWALTAAVAIIAGYRAGWIGSPARASEPSPGAALAPEIGGESGSPQ